MKVVTYTMVRQPNSDYPTMELDIKDNVDATHHAAVIIHSPAVMSALMPLLAAFGVPFRT